MNRIMATRTYWSGEKFKHMFDKACERLDWSLSSYGDSNMLTYQNNYKFDKDFESELKALEFLSKRFLQNRIPMLVEECESLTDAFKEAYSIEPKDVTVLNLKRLIELKLHLTKLEEYATCVR